jgi:hypothetical protein
MDNATATNLAILKQKAQQIIDERTAEIDRLCHELTVMASAPA